MAIIPIENSARTGNFTCIMEMTRSTKMCGRHGDWGQRSRQRRLNVYFLVSKTVTKRLDRFYRLGWMVPKDRECGSHTLKHSGSKGQRSKI